MARLNGLFVLLVGLTITVTVSARYQLVQDYSGTNFYRNFDFFTGPDPTQGHVQYKNIVDANATGIAGFINGGNATNAVFMAVDTSEVAPQGRGSVRVTSKQSFDRFLLVADIVHMPEGCGTWPAFWTVGRNWPYDGEIDIIEGVNDQIGNFMTLHTSASLQLQDPTLAQAANTSSSANSKSFAGRIATSNCAIDAPNQFANQGCAIQDPSPLTYGTGFNAAGGGVFAVERTSSSIRMWFWPRGHFPADIVNASPVPNVDPYNWGAPRAIFQGDFNMDDHFKAQQIVFDTTFCGQWAGPNFLDQGSQCKGLASSCEAFVTEHPEAFKEAYWAVNTLLVFQDDGVGNGEGLKKRHGHLGKKHHI